jgi:hypothetical protein
MGVRRGEAGQALRGHVDVNSASTRVGVDCLPVVWTPRFDMLCRNGQIDGTAQPCHY